MLLIAQLIERLVVAQEVASLSLAGEPKFFLVCFDLMARDPILRQRADVLEQIRPILWPGNRPHPISECGFFVFRVPVCLNAGGGIVMGKRIAVMAVWIEDRSTVPEVNRLFSEYQELVRGRMGMPFRDFSANLISLILEGNTDQLGALSGKLGMLHGVTAKILFLTK